METRISNLEAKMGELDKNVAVFGEIVTRFDKSINKLSDSLERFDSAVHDLKTSMLELGNDVECNQKEVSLLKAKVEEIDGKGKWDWPGFITSKVIPFLIGSGAIYAITELIKK